MSEDFRPGDLVECVDAKPNSCWGPTHLSEGELYTIEAVALSLRQRPVVRLMGLPLPRLMVELYGDRCGYGAWRFRLLKRRDPDLISKLLSEPVEMEPA